MKRAALVPVLLAAASLAGCGATANPPGPNASGAPSAAGAPMSVGITDGRLGGALTDSSDDRERELSQARPIDPRVLRPAPNVREGVGAGDQCANADMLPDPGNLAAVSAATLCLLNAERADRGLTTLKLDRELQAAALRHGGDMVSNGYFAHEGRNGSKPAQRIRAAGYLSSGAWRIGENLAWGTGELSTPRSIMAAWKNSAGHRDNILLPAYREVGFGVVAGNPRSRDGSGATFVTEFGVVERSARSSARSRSGSARRVASHDRRSSRAEKRRAAHRRARAKARMRARRSRARRARLALAPHSRRGRVVGRIARTRAGLG